MGFMMGPRPGFSARRSHGTPCHQKLLWRAPAAAGRLLTHRMLTPSAPLGPLSFFSRLISFRRVGYPRRSKGLALVITTVAAAIFLAVSSHLGGGQDRQIIETVGAMVVSSLVGKAVSTVVSAAVEEAIVMDVFDQRNKCYESYLAHPWSSCREGFVAVSQQWTYLHCCPSEPSDCYAVSNCFGDGPCADGYVLVEEGGCRDVCCPADLSRSPCFESQKCFYDCPAEYQKVEAGSFLDMPLPESLSCADTCCPTRRCFASKLCNAQVRSSLHPVCASADLIAPRSWSHAGVGVSAGRRLLFGRQRARQLVWRRERLPPRLRGHPVEHVVAAVGAASGFQGRRPLWLPRHLLRRRTSPRGRRGGRRRGGGRNSRCRLRCCCAGRIDGHVTGRQRRHRGRQRRRVSVPSLLAEIEV